MLCEKCKKKEACYHSTLVVNGDSKSTHLCEDCARAEGVFAKNTSIFDDFRSLTNMLGFNDFDDIVCKNCGMTLRQFRDFGLLGCEKCYDTFEDEIEDIIRRVQPYNQHVADKIEFKTEGKQAELSKEQKLASLKQDLKNAISEERYEDAGVINKQIKKLEKEIKGE